MSWKFIICLRVALGPFAENNVSKNTKKGNGQKARIFLAMVHLSTSFFLALGFFFTHPKEGNSIWRIWKFFFYLWFEK